MLAKGKNDKGYRRFLTLRALAVTAFYYTRSERRKPAGNTMRGTSKMENLRQIHNRQKRALFFLLALLVLGWGFTPWPKVFAGLILGILFGLYNFWILVRRMEKFDRTLTEGTRAPSLGSGIRFASGVAAAAIAISLPETFDLIATVIGLMIPYGLMLAERITYHLKHQDSGEKER